MSIIGLVMAIAPYIPTVEPAPARPVTLTREQGAAGLRAFFSLADAWGLDNEQARILLGRPGRATFFKWKKGESRKLPFDTLRRISYLLGIWKALQILFQEPARADAWVHRENADLLGQSALDRMLAGDVTDLAAVRALLDAVRGGTP
jgi:hypothetical protein